YCLSEEGQALWGVRRDGARGRSGMTLHHYPIDPGIYEKYGERMAVSENPIKSDFGLKPDPARFEKLVSILDPLVRAASGENHILLQQAWEAACAGQQAAVS